MKWCGACLLAICFSTSVSRADMEVHARRDVVVLNDGTEVPCIVLMISPTAVLIVEAGGKDKDKKTQRVIPRAQVKDIVRGEPMSGSIEGLQTDAEFARKVINGSGFRDEIAKGDKKKGKDGGDAKVAAGEKPKNTEPKNPFEPKTKPATTAEPQATLPEGTLTSKDLTDTYLSRFPELKSTALDLFGEQRIQEVFESARTGNESARHDLETFLQPFIGVDKDQASAKTAPNRLSRLQPIPRPIPEKTVPEVAPK